MKEQDPTATRTARLPLDDPSDAGVSLDCGLTPSGRIDVRPGLPDGPTPIAAATAERIDLLQKNDANSFVFVSRNTPEQPPGDGELHPVLPFLLEAMRRVDEFQQAEALVPAEARFSETKIRPTQVADEQDTTFLRNLWEKASSGISPAQCETQFPVDSYRIRRCYEHWLQEGSLTPFSEVKKTTNSEN